MSHHPRVIIRAFQDRPVEGRVIAESPYGALCCSDAEYARAERESRAPNTVGVAKADVYEHDERLAGVLTEAYARQDAQQLVTLWRQLKPKYQRFAA